MTIFVHVVILALRSHAAWPDAPIDRVVAASSAAVRAETSAAPAELLMAIAQHESDLEPRTVSWRRGGGKRVDRIVTSVEEVPSTGPLACGLVSTIASTRDACAELLDPDRAMAAGAAELGEHAAACRGSVRCQLASYAGGSAGVRAWRAHARTSATIFAEAFIRRAEQLGASWSGW